MKIYTIGFTKKSAEEFFDLLKKNKVNQLIDIRLHPDGQLAGFTKRDDLAYFLKHLIGCGYQHLDNLAPAPEILTDYRKDHDWDRYVGRFEALMDERNIPDTLDKAMFEKHNCCLLCSEDKPDKCHRRLIVERMARHWPNVEIIHIT